MPMNPIDYPCSECGGRVRLVATAGRTGSHRGSSGYAIPANLEIPTCDDCGAEVD